MLLTCPAVPGPGPARQTSGPHRRRSTPSGATSKATERRVPDPSMTVQATPNPSHDPDTAQFFRLFI
jgi:hypothetical protein